MRRHTVARSILLCAAALPAAAQSKSPQETSAGTAVDLSAARPGRDPSQPIDEEYTKKIQEYTTESFFLSPLVDYLPASPAPLGRDITCHDTLRSPQRIDTTEFDQAAIAARQLSQQ